MGTISNALSSYYQLANLTSGSGNSLSGSTSSTTTSPTETLAEALNAAESSGSGSGSSFLLDLSPTAQSLMSGSSTSASSGSGSSSFTLTTAQQTAIKNILKKYEDAPADQATFDAIQNALQAAGLSPQTLGAEDQITSFNGTDTLLSALNGNTINIQDPSTTAAGEQTKETNYMESIVSEWKSLSSAAATSSASGSSSSTLA